MNKDLIQFSVENTADCSRKLEVKIDAQEVTNTFSKVINMYKSKAQVPGFRPGKTPQSIILKRYRDDIEANVKKELIEGSLQTITQDDKNLAPLNQPDIKEEEVVNKKEYSYSATYDVAPVFNLPDYKKLSLEENDTSLSEEEEKQELEKLKSYGRTLSKVEEEIKEGDFIKAAISSTYKADDMPEGVDKILIDDDAWLPVNETSKYPNIKDKLIGKKAGDKISENISFPKDYAFNDYLQEKEIDFSFVIKEVHSYVDPELNDDFAKKMGFESLEKLQEQVIASAKSSKEYANKESLRKQSMDQLVKDVDFSVPDSLWDYEANRLLQEYQQNAGNVAEIKEDEDLTVKAKKEAKENLQKEFILQKIAEEENIEVAQEDLLQEIQKISAQTQKPLEETIELVKKNNYIHQMSAMIRNQKTLDRIIDLADKKLKETQ